MQSGQFENYCECLAGYGYCLQDGHCFGDSTYCTYVINSDALFLSFYPATGQMRIVAEPDCGFLSYTDNSTGYVVTSLITQIDLESFGMSYAVRLNDGRFIILDGGWDFMPDADKLMNCLMRQCPQGRPRIAAWVLTHPHIDHYRCFAVFYEKYGDAVDIEKLIYNFPDFTEEFFKKNTRP